MAPVAEQQPSLVIPPSDYPGKLIVVEGLKGSGKTTQIKLLQSWLEAKGYATAYTLRRSSKLVAKLLEAARAARRLTPETYSLLYAADFADRLEQEVLPALRAGFIVLADKYTPSALACDTVRGNPWEWVAAMYSFAPTPDLIFYIDVDPDDVLSRHDARAEIDYYDAGQDVTGEDDIFDSLRAYSKLLRAQYRKVSQTYPFDTVDGGRSIKEQQEAIRAKVLPLLKTFDASPMRTGPR